MPSVGLGRTELEEFSLFGRTHGGVALGFG